MRHDSPGKHLKPGEPELPGSGGGWGPKKNNKLRREWATRRPFFEMLEFDLLPKLKGERHQLQAPPSDILLNTLRARRKLKDVTVKVPIDREALEQLKTYLELWGDEEEYPPVCIGKWNMEQFEAKVAKWLMLGLDTPRGSHMGPEIHLMIRPADDDIDGGRGDQLETPVKFCLEPSVELRFNDAYLQRFEKENVKRIEAEELDGRFIDQDLFDKIAENISFGAVEGFVRWCRRHPYITERRLR
ncbi:hypothetical protein BJ508DRAFT_338658 [Ascobolus immersus RN42]|uniref:Uncharacterized protein n=1 Tax=Ascobolus immersus RN42 TaxID=1160509 RepID=A0A3N4I174_ASCIM|nr:hypothetical protein BJ508DRAFT_338658 [Ascobolus immersus RN42]